MSTNYHKLTLRGNTLLAIPENLYSRKQIAAIMDERVSDLVLEILSRDAANDDNSILTAARSYLLDTVAAENLGTLAGKNGQKLDVIRIVRHVYDCGLAAAQELTELFMGLKTEFRCAQQPASSIVFVIEV